MHREFQLPFEVQKLPAVMQENRKKQKPRNRSVRLPSLLPAAVASCGLLPVVVAVAYAVERDK
jgi:hypothetical protein